MLIQMSKEHTVAIAFEDTVVKKLEIPPRRMIPNSRPLPPTSRMTTVAWANPLPIKDVYVMDLRGNHMFAMFYANALREKWGIPITHTHTHTPIMLTTFT